MKDGSIGWFARNGVAANLLMALILTGGAMTLFTIKQEVFPEFSVDMISVSVAYLGAAPEEVEEALKTHPDVEDAVVVGVPDERWGQAVTGVVELRRGAELDEAGLRQHVSGRLAGFKVPKRILPVSSMGRAVNGKADYAGIRALALERLLD